MQADAGEGPKSHRPKRDGPKQIEFSGHDQARARRTPPKRAVSAGSTQLLGLDEVVSHPNGENSRENRQAHAAKRA